MTSSPYRFRIANTVSSNNKSYFWLLSRFFRKPTYSGSFKWSSLFVPVSIWTGNSHSGLTPLAAYTIPFPTEIPIPFAPWSPKPSIRSPSVITAILTPSFRHLFTNFSTLPASFNDTHNPRGRSKISPNLTHASPTVGVYKIGSNSSTFVRNRL